MEIGDSNEEKALNPTPFERLRDYLKTSVAVLVQFRDEVLTTVGEVMTAVGCATILKALQALRDFLLFAFNEIHETDCLTVQLTNGYSEVAARVLAVLPEAA